MPLAHRHQLVHQPVDVGAEYLAENLVLALADDVGPGVPDAGDLPVQVGQRFLAGGVDEQAADDVEEVVPGGAGDRPRREGLAAAKESGLEDLLGHDPGVAAALVVEAPEVPGRVPQPVGVVDTEAVDPAVGDQAEHEGMGGVEDPPVLHAQADQGRDVEEAAVAQLLAGGPPEREAVALALEQGVEVVGLGVDGSDGGVDGLGHVGLLLQQAGQLGAQDLLVAVALLHAGFVGGGRWREPAVVGGQAGQLVRVGVDRGGGQQLVERARRHWHEVVVVADDEAGVLTFEAQFARLENPAVVVA